MNPVTIAGGGLAGLSLGIALARRDIPVELHEASVYPRHRVCGEFLCGLRSEDATDLGIADDLADAMPQHTCAWFAGHKTLLSRTLPRPGWGISRHCLDHRLANRFTQCGGHLHTRSRHLPTPRPGLVWAAGKPSSSRSPWVALKCHLFDFSLEADLEMHLGRRAYAGLSRVEDGRVNLCALIRKPQHPPASGHDLATILRWLQLAGLDHLAQRLANASEVPGTFTAIAGFSFGTPCPHDALLRLGDSYSLIPPFTGNGMSMALESALVALDPVSDYARGKLPWNEAVARIHTALHRRFRRRLAWAASLHPFLLHPSGYRLLRHLAPLLPFPLLFQRLRTP